MEGESGRGCRNENMLKSAIYNTQIVVCSFVLLGSARQKSFVVVLVASSCADAIPCPIPGNTDRLKLRHRFHSADDMRSTRNKPTYGSVCGCAANLLQQQDAELCVLIVER